MMRMRYGRSLRSPAMVIACLSLITMMVSPGIAIGYEAPKILVSVRGPARAVPCGRAVTLTATVLSTDGAQADRSSDRPLEDRARFADRFHQRIPVDHRSQGDDVRTPVHRKGRWEPKGQCHCRLDTRQHHHQGPVRRGDAAPDPTRHATPDAAPDPIDRGRRPGRLHHRRWNAPAFASGIASLT